MASSDKTTAAAEYVQTVKTVQDVNVFGISGKQIASTMLGSEIELKEVPKGIQVTSKRFPGKRHVIYNANIACVTFATAETES